MPERIQLRRKKGWRLRDISPDAIVVARPSRWGNPYTLDQYREHYPEADEHELRRMAVSDFHGLVTGRWDGFDDVPVPDYPRDQIVTELRGHDLACWCPLVDEHGQAVPCHADVLLELANA